MAQGGPTRKHIVAGLVVVSIMAGGVALWPAIQPSIESLFNTDAGGEQAELAENAPLDATPSNSPLQLIGLADSGAAVAQDGSKPEAQQPEPAPARKRARTSDQKKTPPKQKQGAAPVAASAGSAPDGQRLAQNATSALARGDLLEARRYFTQALKAGLQPAQRADAERQLLVLAEQTLLNKKALPGDPLVETYKIQSNDTLGKIARRYRLTAELLARINGIKNPNRIRLGQKIKVLRGPFRAEIFKHDHRMLIFLQDTLVKEFKVGLGADGSTPTGEWRIKDKLVNPTYYAPDGSGVVAAEDPKNPLGERWLGFEGVGGDALGQEAYGIHGTIEPESIGTDASLGCVRMHNEDVEFVYDLLVATHSEVVVFD